MRTVQLGVWMCVLSPLALVSACNNEDAEAQNPEERATLEVKAYLQGELDKLADAAARLQQAAPAPDDNGWNAADDKAAVEKMRSIWGEARDLYEHSEGAIAELFMELDVSTDERYDAFIEDNGPDDNLFDGENVTGMHAIERILWADSHPAHVVAFESTLVGYQAAAFPGTRVQAEDFKTKLAQRLVDDTAAMRDMFAGQRRALDPSTAFGGVIGSMEEQFEKVNLAATAGDESRYAQRTLDDMRANLEGGLQIYRAFSGWVVESSGAELDKKVKDGFGRIDAGYDAVEGAAIPDVPADFDGTKPSEADLKTPYGQLWQLLTDEGNARSEGSLVHAMVKAGEAMGIDIQ